MVLHAICFENGLKTGLAKQTGETLTRAVTESLRERLARVEKDRQMAQRKRRIDEISRRYVANMTGPPINLEEFLYDEKGLPK